MSYTHLTLEERYCIAHMYMAKFSIRQIAERLNRSPSTISREIKRNNRVYGPYWYDSAQKFSDERKAKPTNEKRKLHQPLYDLVVKNIRQEINRVRVTAVPLSSE